LWIYLSKKIHRLIMRSKIKWEYTTQALQRSEKSIVNQCIRIVEMKLLRWNETRIFDTSCAVVEKVYCRLMHIVLKWECARVDMMRENEKKMKWSRRKIICLYALMKTNNVSRVQNHFIAKIFVKIIDCFINNFHVFDFILQLFYSFEQSNVIDFQRR
jgi:hypothetical protein